ncbi:MAG TPA: PPC domain-containing protein, partial [Aggregatilineales bacterium]|nr:PPC domain-containing protein [Aggregatilineales bacterium]
VTINVNGDTLQPLSGTLKPTQQYVASFIITSPEQITMEPGGPNLSIDLTPFAAKIAAPTTMTGKTSVTGTIDHTNPADAWSITVGQNAAPLTINMTASSGSLDSFLILLGPDGNIIASNDDANENTRDSQIANQTLSAGRYTIVATRFAQQIGGTEGNYTLTANNGARTTTVTSNSLTQTAAAITPTSAQLPPGSIQVKLTWNSRADLRLLIRDPNGVSVFSDNTSPDNSGILDRLGNFKCTSTTTSPTTYAYWPTNLLPPGTYEVGVWLQSRCTDTTILPQYNLSVVVKGQQVIQITDRPDSTSVPGLHSLTTFTVDANGNATAGPRGIVREEFTADITSLKASAPALSYGTPISATIDSTNPFRLFQFTASNGDKVAITLRNTSGDLDPNLFLLNANGVQINANDDVTPSKDINSRIEQTIKADGTYYIVATRYGQDVGGTSGTFELTIARLNQ